MKFTEILSYVVTALTLLIVGGVAAQSNVWSVALVGPIVWLTQTIAYGLLVVAAACMICRKNVRDLAPWTVFWSVAVSSVVLLATIIFAGMNQMAPNDIWSALFEFVAFTGIQIALFTFPRTYYYD